MFAGSNRLTIDEKGRLAVPARVRAQLAEEYGKQIAITLGPECVEIYPSPVFRRMVEQIQKIPDRAKRVVMQRLFVGHAVESELDGQGRVLIPPMLRERLKLGADVVLAGLNDHFELWPEAQWTASTETAQVSYADAFAALGP
ncbi:MAG: mraZ [Nevskia sp.]|nr:mraZ [Nevskia sp.]